MIDLLGQRAVKKGMISGDELSQAIERQRIYGGRLGYNLTALDLISESELTDFFSFAPQEPASAKDINLEIGFITDLILRHCIFVKKFTIAYLRDKIKLPASVILDIVTDLRRDGFVEIAQGELSLLDCQYSMTSAGINRAAQALEECRYVGPAPVSLEEYRYAVEIQTIRSVEIIKENLKDAFSGLVLDENKIDSFGSAVNSAKTIFLYGPAGNGKTTIAEALANSLPGEVYIPYSVLVGNQIVVVYDQVSHRAVESGDAGNRLDARWIKIKRPVVKAGGELTLKALDLDYNPVSKYYEAPLQMKANNGAFIVDDFGRQIVDSQILLNRWIVPLDRQTDFLTLHTGMKFEIPFDQMVIFATNLQPEKIADPAFLRRLRYKFRLNYATVGEFRRIFQNICDSNKMEYDEEVFIYLMKKYDSSQRKLSFCHPRDLVDQIIDFASFHKVPAKLTKKSIDRAWENYFVY